MLNGFIAGNIGKDAESRQAGQSNVTSFSVAVEQRGRDGKTTQWVNCSMWGKRGDAVMQYLTKGTSVAVSGELSLREYNGKTYLEMNVSDVTLQGGGRQRDRSDTNQQSSYQQDRGSGFGGGADMDDEIPF